MGSRLIILGAVVFAIGILFLALVLIRIVKRIRYRDTGNHRHRAPESPGPAPVILGLLFVVIGQSILWLASQIGSYRPIDDQGLVGRLRVERLSDPVKSLRVTYIPSGGEGAGMANQFYLSGDSWRLTGEIIAFKFARDYLDLPARACKTTAFSSRYLERVPPRASGALLNEIYIEGGGSAAFRLFRDIPYFDWFADIDSFAIDYITTTHTDSYTVRLSPEGELALELEN